MTPAIENAERPILFSGPMVRAILDGRKTETRRVHYPCGKAYPGQQLPPNAALRPCPYGQPGDLLYVRETWAAVHPCQVAVGRPSMPSTAGIPGPPPVAYRTIYRADGPYPGVRHIRRHPWREAIGVGEEAPLLGSVGDSWAPSVHMPKRFARIWLRVEDVRIERVQDITEAGALSEGIPPEAGFVARGTTPVVAAFRQFWNDNNLKRGFGWDANPWVWVVQFSVASTTGRFGFPARR